MENLNQLETKLCYLVCAVANLWCYVACDVVLACMYHYFGSVLKFLTSQMFSSTLTTTPSTWTMTWPIVIDPSRFLKRMFVLPGDVWSSSTKSNGLTILKKKQRGNVKIILDANSPTSLAPKPSKSRDEIYSKGGRICNIP